MYTVFEKLLREKGLKVADVCRATGIRQGVFSDWKAGRYTPKADKMALIANCLGVSLEYLTTGQKDEEKVFEFTAGSHMLMYSILDLIGKSVKQDNINGNVMITDDGVEYCVSESDYNNFCNSVLNFTNMQFNTLKGHAKSITIQFAPNDPRRNKIAHALDAAHDDHTGTEEERQESRDIMTDDIEWR